MILSWLCNLWLKLSELQVFTKSFYGTMVDIHIHLIIWSV